MIRERTAQPNYREIFGGLAILTVLAGLSVTRWGLPQSGQASFREVQPAPNTIQDPEDNATTQSHEDSVQSTTTTSEDDTEPFHW